MVKKTFPTAEWQKNFANTLRKIDLDWLDSIENLKVQNHDADAGIIYFTEPAQDLKSKKKLAKTKKKAIADLLKANKKRKLQIELINIVEK